MAIVKVTPVRYKSKYMKYYRPGIQILNRNINTFTLIDVKTLQKVNNAAECAIITCEDSVGNIYFNFK